MNSDREDIRKVIADLYAAWINAIQSRRFDWFESNLADDYTCTARPFDRFFMHKREFIESDKAIDCIDIELVDVRAHRVGDVVLSSLVAHLRDLILRPYAGHGVTGGAQIDAAIKGKTIAYASAWRRTGNTWQCFDHHLVGPLS